MSIDHALVVGFGGPERPEDVRPFLEEVTRGARVPPARLDAVARHYALTGGASPYNAHTRRLVDAVTRRLAARGASLPVFVGMRNWHPFLRDVLPRIRQQDLSRGVAFVLAPHRCEASFEKYVRSVEEARAATGDALRPYDYVGPWHEAPGFIEAQAAHVSHELDRLPDAQWKAAHLIFCAHSIPVEVAGRSRYAEEFDASSRLVAQRLGHASWSLAYQSRSGEPRQPWLGPDVGDELTRLASSGVRHVVLVPIGFLSDHTEVLYDLDIEAREHAGRLGLGFHRASTVMDHPAFVDMIVERLCAHVSSTLGSSAVQRRS